MCTGGPEIAECTARVNTMTYRMLNPDEGERRSGSGRLDRPAFKCNTARGQDGLRIRRGKVGSRPPGQIVRIIGGNIGEESLRGEFRGWQASTDARVRVLPHGGALDPRARQSESAYDDDPGASPRESQRDPARGLSKTSAFRTRTTPAWPGEWPVDVGEPEPEPRSEARMQGRPRAFLLGEHLKRRNTRQAENRIDSA